MFGDALVTLPEGVPYRIEGDSVFGSPDGQEFDTEGIALGIAFLLEALDVVNLRFEVLLPIFAIAVGLVAIVSSLLRTRQG